MENNDVKLEEQEKIIEDLQHEYETEKLQVRTVSESAKFSRTDDLYNFFFAHGFALEKPISSYKFSRASYRRLSKNGKNWIAAYKTDWKLHETHRVFIETWSTWKSGKSGEGGRGKSGWVYDVSFDTIIVYCPQDAYFIWIPRKKLENNLAIWEEKYGVHEVQNVSWITLGHAVPEEEIIALGKKIIMKII